MDMRELKGLELAARSRIVFQDGAWIVPSQFTTGTYRVTLSPEGDQCECEDFALTQKHGLTFVGDPEYVVHEIRAHMKELGAGVLMGLFQFGSMPHALAKKNIELFATKVLPALKRD